MKKIKMIKKKIKKRKRKMKKNKIKKKRRVMKQKMIKNIKKIKEETCLPLTLIIISKILKLLWIILNYLIKKLKTKTKFLI